MTGKSVGPYVIGARLGAGGMGEVYRAKDTRLGREVALKVLPPAVAGDSARSKRFEQEAHAVAALNHPNIVSIYDTGRQDGIYYIVSELVEGETLRNVQFSLRKAIEVATQIADGLTAAHEFGIVHRDLKPENVMVTRDGRVKILDFGLAKQQAAAAEPMQTLTEPGTVMGTVGYMSPEQVRGQATDHHSDIFSFGLLLHELLAGKRAFTGENAVDVMNAILHHEPAELPETVPAGMRQIVAHCIEKDSAKRFQSARDLAFALRTISGTMSGAVAATGSEAQKERQRSWLPWGVAAVLAAGLAVAGLRGLRAPTPEVRSTQFLLEAPGDTQFSAPFAGTAVSPDGRYLVFAAGSQGSAPLWLRPLDSLSARPLQGTEGGNLPFWSPDSKSIAFYAGGKLKRRDIAGGAPQILCDAASGLGAGGTWSRDGVLLFGSAEGLFRVPAFGGVPQAVTQLDTARKESTHGMPQFLPDGKRFLYFIQSPDQNTQGIYAGSLDDPKDRTRILATNRKAYYVPTRDGRTGFLLWLREQTLLAQPFDAAKLRLEGDPMPLAEEVALGFAGGRAAFWTSDAGLLVYRTRGAFAKQKLLWISRNGKRLGEAGKEDYYGSVQLSPDGTRVAVDRLADDGTTDIWVMEFGREVMMRLTFDPKSEGIPVWSPDGRQIAYYSDRSGVRQIYRIKAGGGGQEEQLTNSPNGKMVTNWSGDSRYLLYGEFAQELDLWALPLEGERKPVAVMQTSFFESAAQFSPDGKWIAYQSNQSGRDEVYVRAFPVSSGQWQVSTQGGSRPKWRADGKELFYLGPNMSNILAADIRIAGASVQSDTPRELFTISRVPPIISSPFDVTADGQRFLVLQPSTEERRFAPLTVVTNWQAGLKK